ncbi:hypothetical protein TRFO_03835 [Tritrichomonas foetus]|uniref:Uncharacterized protein n=1 Tax=Tritrichomonas foetus TaxID=1144522 RepID=A0A1J4KQC4_9EUKA|nr:hypothetical protein TRFO_03835 [Tritrichomonas foetus]|eukprot:OHT11637.1 hypothetical protein TRFO_03835 [Tritrichomonas foetus]
MYTRAPLSARRRISIKTTNFEPMINSFLREAIKFESPPEQPPEIERERRPKTERRVINNGSTPRTGDEIRAGRRRAFERAHQMQCEKVLKNSEKQWKEQIKYRDWKTKQTMKKIEPRRYAEDRHVLEDIVHERNAYYLEAIATSEQGTQNRISNLRTLPKELRANSQAYKQTRLWV